MFRIVKQPRAWWPVTWTGVTEDGELVTNRIEMRFRLLKLDDFVRMQSEVGERRDALAAQAQTGDGEAPGIAAVYAELVERIAEDWRQIAGENGEPLPWNRANLTLLMNEPKLFERVMLAFQGLVESAGKVIEGN